MREGRTNITLDPETATALREYIDAIEREFGFRPTAAQAVRGLITRAALSNGGQHEQ